MFSGPSFFWSVGPAIAQTIFDAGKTHGQVQEAQANYDATVANYRQVVLTAFQQVEDDLSGLRILKEEAAAEDQAVKSAQQVARHLHQRIQGRHGRLSDRDHRPGDRAERRGHRGQYPHPPHDHQRAAGRGAGRRLGRLELAEPAGVADVPPAQAQIEKGKQ